MKVAHRTLLVISLFVGIPAIICGFLMAIDPSGKLMMMESLIPTMQTWPLADIFFRDIFWSGVALLCVNGISNLVCAILLLKHQAGQYPIAALCGILLMLWTGWELYAIFNLISVFYFIIGAMQLALAIYTLRREKKTNSLSQNAPSSSN